MTDAVCWPLEAPIAAESTGLSALGHLRGRRIAFLWDYLFKGPEMFSIIQAELEAEFDDLSFVSYEVFGNIHGADPEERKTIAEIPGKLRQWGVDAAVLAVGA